MYLLVKIGLLFENIGILDRNPSSLAPTDAPSQTPTTSQIAAQSKTPKTPQTRHTTVPPRTTNSALPRPKRRGCCDACDEDWVAALARVAHSCALRRCQRPRDFVPQDAPPPPGGLTTFRFLAVAEPPQRRPCHILGWWCASAWPHLPTMLRECTLSIGACCSLDWRAC